MPVLSPHRGSASTLTGNYRSSINTTTGIDRPYYNSTTNYNPRLTSNYSERFVTRSYTDSDGKRIFSRSGSITEDGITTRFREESRDFVSPSTSTIRRDSQSRDSGISSDYSIIGRRENSLTRDSSSTSSSSLNNRLTAVNVIESVAELRNKYSPANYIPACQRNNRKNNDLLGRSKSINDIGLPPIDSTTLTTTNSTTTTPTTNSTPTTKHLNQKKKVNNDGLNLTTSVVLLSNNTNDDLINNGDDNGNRTQSVADLRKKFDDKTTIIETTKSIINGESNTPTIKINDNVFKKQDQNKINNKTINKTTIINRQNHENGDNIDDYDDNNKDNINGIHQKKSRVNNFASYIPSKDYLQQQQLNGSNNEEFDDNSSNNNNNIINNNNSDNIDGCSSRQEVNKRSSDIGSTPKLSIISPSSSSSSTSNTTTTTNSLNNSNNNSLTRRSIDRNIDDLLLESSSTSSSLMRTTPTINQLGLNGLKNIGNTCFMNSVIQCLSNTKQLLEYLLNDHYINDINTTISSMKGALIRSFAEVIKELWSCDKIGNVINTVSLKSQIQRFAPRFMGYSQQDAQEFLRYLLEGLHEDVNRIIEKPKLNQINDLDYDKLNDNEKSNISWKRYLLYDNSKIVDCFVGQLKSTLKCTYCGHCSVTFDPFWDLSLPIPQRIGQIRLSQCLDSFTREETLDGDEKPTCSKCKERRKCTKSFTIQKFPKILVIHLKRFSLAERFRGKLNVTIDFPLEGLDMSNYAADNVTSCRYNLYAVSNHSGTTYSGHYTAYCRHPYSKTWHEYNDSRVSSISSKSIVSGEAYVLFYEQDGQKSHL